MVLGGSVLTARDPLLIGWITERLAGRRPARQVSVVQVPPIAGAALLGLDRAGAAPDAERRLRAAYPPRRRLTPAPDGPAAEPDRMDDRGRDCPRPQPQP